MELPNHGTMERQNAAWHAPFRHSGYYCVNELTEGPMSRYLFAISSGPESIRQAGVVESSSFDEAVSLLGERIHVQTGDSLEIGVNGFPPARYSCAGAVRNRPIWIPEGQMAA